ncbi:MAG TPA: hypothetical protein VMN76_03580 [Acidobacteriota bacterium]|nr:hypothetical protein [Acidobacteriota bacterium]
MTLQFRLEDDRLEIVDGSFDPDFASGFDPSLKDLGLLDARQVRRSELSRNDRELIERNPGYRFFTFGDFSGEGYSEFALIGTYQTGAALSRERRRSPYRERIGGRGAFLLIRQVGRSVPPNERPADFLVTFEEEFAVLEVSGDQLRVFFCVDCSDGAQVRWSGRSFELAPLEN